jgi:phage terminase Nu1 subunit (DNA packaging protein)
MAQPDELVTLTELAEQIGCSKNTAANWPRAGMPVLWSRPWERNDSKP